MSAGLVEGKDGWLFQTDERVFDWVTGRLEMTKEQVEEWRALYYSRTVHAHQQQATYKLLVAPEKHVVYSDKLPSMVSVNSPPYGDMKISPSRAAFLLSRQIPFVLYPLFDLTREKCRMDVYSPGESHWNGFGAYVVAGLVLSNMRLPVVENVEFWTGQFDRYNDLGSRVGKLLTTMVCKKVSPKAFCIHDNRKFSYGNLKVYVNRDQSLPRLVCFRDSFSSNLLPILAESFSRVVAVATWNYHAELVESERPDFVLHQIAERYVVRHPLTDCNAIGIEALTGEKPETIKQIGRSHVPSEVAEFLY